MGNIDKQRIFAVQAMETLGYTFTPTGWQAPAATAASFLAEADSMYGLLMLRADKLMGCTEGSEEEAELGMLTDAMEAYEAKRWPGGKVPGGKG